MKKIYFFTIAILLFCSCSYKTIPLKNNYSNGNFEEYSIKSVDEVWSNIIEFFAKGGISIKIIDKSSGLIVSDKTEMTWTYENKKGELVNPEAWLVIAKLIDPANQKPVKPESINGEWNIRIKQSGEKTLININLVNPTYSTYRVSGGVRSLVAYNFKKGLFQSTGEFEKWIYETIK